MKVVYSKTKIVATYGPAVTKRSVLLDLIKNGVDVIRFNFSHGSYEDHLQGFNTVKQINEEFGLHIAILADLQGPKIRVGLVEGEGVKLKKGDEIEIVSHELIGSAKKIFVSYDDLYKDVKVGERILLDDGKLEFKVVRKEGESVFAKVVTGGVLKSRKGVNLPNTKTSVPSLTRKDRADLEFALEQGANWIALSFVREAKDVQELLDIIGHRTEYTKVIAKIEKPEAVKDIDNIVAVANGIMVARGDLGVEMPVEQLPMIQKTVIKKCLRAGKPVVVATQMMESMIENPSPTRAEVTDVANAVIDGADAVMLSGETSVGKWPVKVIQTMQKVLINVEKNPDIYNRGIKANPSSETFVSDTICHYGVHLAEEVGAKAIIGMTKSGYTAFMASSIRPVADIYIFTETTELMATLSLCWGVRTFYYNKFVSTDVTIRDVIRILKKNELVEKGDNVINIGSMPLRSRGRTNMLKVTVVN